MQKWYSNCNRNRYFMFNIQQNKSYPLWEFGVWLVFPKLYLNYKVRKHEFYFYLWTMKFAEWTVRLGRYLDGNIPGFNDNIRQNHDFCYEQIYYYGMLSRYKRFSCQIKIIFSWEVGWCSAVSHGFVFQLKLLCAVYVCNLTRQLD